MGAASPTLIRQSLMDFLSEDLKVCLLQLLNPGTFDTITANERLALLTQLEAKSDVNSSEALANELDMASQCLMYWRHLAFWLQLKAGLTTSPTLWVGLSEEAIVGYRDTLAPTASKVIQAIEFRFSDNGRILEERVSHYLESFLWSCSSSQLLNFLSFCTALDILLPFCSINVEFDSTSGLNRIPRAKTCSQTLTLSRNYVCQEDFSTDLVAVLERASVFDSL